MIAALEDRALSKVVQRKTKNRWPIPNLRWLMEMGSKSGYMTGGIQIFYYQNKPQSQTVKSRKRKKRPTAIKTPTSKVEV
jgi:hypothetical protein